MTTTKNIKKLKKFVKKKDKQKKDVHVKSNSKSTK
jgi:hypothetical protein